MRIHIGDECLAFSGTRPSELTVTVAVQFSTVTCLSSLRPFYGRFEIADKARNESRAIHLVTQTKPTVSLLDMSKRLKRGVEQQTKCHASQATSFSCTENWGLRRNSNAPVSFISAIYY